MIKAISQEDFWKILDSLHDEIMIFDDNYHLVYVNKACHRHYGKSPEELIGAHFDALDETYWRNSTLPDVYRKKEMVAKYQITNLGLDIVTISVPVFDENHHLKYVAMNVNDLYNYQDIEKAEDAFLNIIPKAEKEEEFIHSSESMSEVVRYVKRLRNVNSPLLITGETGTGKSQLAKYVHSISDRASRPFVSVNCACVNANLIESELFGYKKGAFSGASASGKKGIVELADKGTLFLDEISEIPLNLQGKLLEFIQEKTFMPLGSEKKSSVDVRIIAATNRDLRQMVKTQAFREDLYYRLNVFEVKIDPLCERPEDISALIDYFMKRYNGIYARNLTLSGEARDVLMKCRWPGNIRELSHIMEKIVVLSDGPEITPLDLPNEIYQIKEDQYSFLYTHEDMADISITGQRTLREAMEETERRIIRETYARCGSSVKVAVELGISQPTAYRLIKKHCAR